jgi:hypothetical protein
MLKLAFIRQSTERETGRDFRDEDKGLEAGPIPLEADCMKFQPFWGWRPASTTHCNKITIGANFPICKGLIAKKLGQFNTSSIIQQI